MNDSISLLRRTASIAALLVVGAMSSGAIAQQPAAARPTPPSYSTSATSTSAAAQVRIGASASLQPLAAAAAKKYGLQATGISVAVAPLQPGGTYVALSGESINVAFADTAPTDKALVVQKIGVLPLAFVTNHAAGVSSLTAAQIGDLLAGRITNWNQLGGGDVPVQVIGRGSYGGITQLLERRYLGGKTIAAPASVAETQSAAVAAVSKTKGGISIVTFDAARAANATLSTLAVDGATADEAHVGDGSYPLWSYAYAVSQGAPHADVARFVSSVVNDRELLRSFGFIAVSDLGPGALKLR